MVNRSGPATRSAPRQRSAKDGTPEGIRTPDPRLRRPLLYPAELRAPISRHVSPIGTETPGVAASGARAGSRLRENNLGNIAHFFPDFNLGFRVGSRPFLKNQRHQTYGLHPGNAANVTVTKRRRAAFGFLANGLG